MADIRYAVQIAASPASIYPLVATAKGFTAWWAEDVTEGAGAVDLGFFHRTTVYRLRFEEGEAPSHAKWQCESGFEWSGTRIEFQLEARGEVAVLRFAHTGWPSETEYFVSCNTTWGELMYRLKAAAEGKPRGPLFLAGALAY